MTDIFRTLIVPAARVELAREIAAAFGPGGQGMWTSAWSSDGSEPATHYISTGFIPEQFAYMVPCKTWEQNLDGTWEETSSAPGDAAAVFAAAQQSNIDCTEADVIALFAACDASDQQAMAAITRLGLVEVRLEG